MSMNKYNSGTGSAFQTANPFRNIQVGTVIATGTIPISTEDDKSVTNRNRKFNADEHAIKVKVIGDKYDNNKTDKELPNAFPLLPKGLNIVPPVGELVIVFMFGENSDDRFYIGPITSSPDKWGGEKAETASANMDTSLVSNTESLENVAESFGVYEDPQNVVIEGRGNTDIIQREGEIVIRAGKFVKNKPRQFNAKNPGFIQIKTDMTYDGEKKETDLTVTNVVSDKINLISYDADFTLTTRKGKKAVYVDDDELKNIIDNAHPMVYGDLLVEYLVLFRKAFEGHVHNGILAKPTDRTDNREGLVKEDFLKKAKNLEKQMLAKNLRIK